MKSRWIGALTLVVAIGLVALSCKKDSNPAGPGGGVGADVTINIVGISGSSSYSPSPDTVTVGQTVSWHNIDGITHTATDNGTPIFDTGNVASGGTSTPIQMNTVGSHDYHCTIHGLSMTGTLVVKP